jgi:hypothetical protein
MVQISSHDQKSGQKLGIRNVYSKNRQSLFGFQFDKHFPLGLIVSLYKIPTDCETKSAPA